MRDALHLVELVRVTGEEPDFQWRAALTESLAAARDPLGGWARPGAELETTAVAVRLIVLVGVWREREDAIADFLRRCEEKVLGLRLGPGARTTSAGALWGGLELARALDLTPSYPRAIAESLALLQRRDGGQGARHCALATLRDTWLGLQAAQPLEQIPEEQP